MKYLTALILLLGVAVFANSEKEVPNPAKGKWTYFTTQSHLAVETELTRIGATAEGTTILISGFKDYHVWARADYVKGVNWKHTSGDTNKFKGVVSALIATDKAIPAGFSGTGKTLAWFVQSSL